MYVCAQVLKLFFQVFECTNQSGMRVHPLQPKEVRNDYESECESEESTHTNRYSVLRTLLNENVLFEI